MPGYRAVTYDEPSLVVGPATEPVNLGAGAANQAVHYEGYTFPNRAGDLQDDQDFGGISYRVPLLGDDNLDNWAQATSGAQSSAAVLGPYAFTDGQGVPLPIDDPSDFSISAGTYIPEGLPGVSAKGIIPERITQSEPARPSASPNSMSLMMRLWDVTMGRWPWTGDKGAMVPPNAASPIMYPAAIPNALPSPGGSASTPPNTVPLSPGPLTNRNTPAPWDETTADGQVGTARLSFYAPSY